MMQGTAATTIGDPPALYRGYDATVPSCSTGCPHCGCYNPNCFTNQPGNFVTVGPEPSFEVPLALKKAAEVPFHIRHNRKPWERKQGR